MMRFSLDAAGIEKRGGTSYEVDKVELKVFNFLLCDATATVSREESANISTHEAIAVGRAVFSAGKEMLLDPRATGVHFQRETPSCLTSCHLPHSVLH